MGNSAARGRNHQRQFKLAMRGYDPNEVDAFLAQFSDDPDLPVPGFARVMRGYDAEQVDLHIENVKALGSRPPS
jgi:DivIVA domain-containing protein